MRSAHVFVCERLFESVVGHEAHARLGRISDDESRTAGIHPTHAARAQRLADYREWCLALQVVMYVFRGGKEETVAFRRSERTEKGGERNALCRQIVSVS